MCFADAIVFGCLFPKMYKVVISLPFIEKAQGGSLSDLRTSLRLVSVANKCVLSHYQTQCLPDSFWHAKSNIALGSALSQLLAS